MNIKNRGMMLESIINKTISIYKRNNIGLFHKKELNIKFKKINEVNGKLNIDSGVIHKKSTADYYGLINGKYVAFEAKSTKLTSLPLANIKEHQLDYLSEVESFGGISFFIVAFQKYDEYYMIYPDTIKSITRKSLSIEKARSEGTMIEFIYPGILDFAGFIK